MTLTQPMKGVVIKRKCRAWDEPTSEPSEQMEKRLRVEARVPSTAEAAPHPWYSKVHHGTISFEDDCMDEASDSSAEPCSEPSISVDEKNEGRGNDYHDGGHEVVLPFSGDCSPARPIVTEETFSPSLSDSFAPRAVRFAEDVKEFDGLSSKSRVVEDIVVDLFTTRTIKNFRDIARKCDYQPKLFYSLFNSLQQLENSLQTEEGHVPLLPRGGGRCIRLGAPHQPLISELKRLVRAGVRAMEAKCGECPTCHSMVEAPSTPVRSPTESEIKGELCSATI